MSEWKFLTADEIVKWYGERCSDTEPGPGCPTCAAWLRHDMLKQWEFEDINSRIDLAKDEAEGWGCLNEAPQDYPINEAVLKMMEEENERIDAVDERLRHYSPEFVRLLDEHEWRHRSLEIVTKKMLDRRIGDNEEEV